MNAWSYTSTPHTYSWRDAKLIKYRDNFTAKETHYVSATKPNRLMPFREIIAVCCENHTEGINALVGKLKGLSECYSRWYI
jgi:hypothetical protein